MDKPWYCCQKIVLTSQLINRFETRFGFRPLEWHSNLTSKTRRENWQRVAKGDAKFIVGARSALFLPFNNLKLIVIDEEHDQSFKQEEGAIYNARDMAILKAKLENIAIILSSATPSIESIYNVQNKKYKELKLHSRFGDAVLPEIKLIDLSKEIMPKNQWISNTLRQVLTINLASGQTIHAISQSQGLCSDHHVRQLLLKSDLPELQFSYGGAQKQGNTPMPLLWP
jgi:primosomal protein N' (replication factor Y)